MNPLEGSPLGATTIERVFVQYDGPRLFVAVDRAGRRHLVMWLGDDDDADRWLAVEVSSERLADLERRTMTLRSAFRHAERGLVRELATRDGKWLTALERRAASLPDDDLPAYGAMLTSGRDVTGVFAIPQPTANRAAAYQAWTWAAR